MAISARQSWLFKSSFHVHFLMDIQYDEEPKLINETRLNLN